MGCGGIQPTVRWQCVQRESQCLKLKTIAMFDAWSLSIVLGVAGEWNPSVAIVSKIVSKLPNLIETGALAGRCRSCVKHVGSRHAMPTPLTAIRMPA